MLEKGLRGTGCWVVARRLKGLAGWLQPKPEALWVDLKSRLYD